MNIGNWVFDIKTNHITLSNELCKIYGLDPTEKSTTLNRVMELIHPDDKQMIQDRTRDYLETGTPGGSEFRMIRPSGDIVYLYGQSKAIYNSEGQITSLMGIVQDITESKQIQTERERTQRLRALGEMAAGISHNLNNILTGILGPAQMLQITNKDAQIGEDIDTILTAGLRARDIVSRLNQGWRTDTEAQESTDLNQAIQEAVQATRPRWKDAPETKGIHIQINQHLAEIPPLQGTQSGLYDIIINLIFNAVDAMPNGGRISLTTLQTQDCVRLLFSDTGTGMSMATQRRIFDPFFTTKEQIGTGLGLSTVYGTITRWNGSIDVASTQGQGTTFTLDFAIWEKDQIEYATPTTTKSDQVGRILIVEDEKVVAQVLNRVLSSHNIDTASSSPKALEIFEPNKYDILITDLGLPHMPGDQLAQQFRQKDPNLVTILISGWELLPNDSRRTPFDFFVQKPFHDLDMFRQIITDALALKNSRDSQNT
ncbi:MAG: PAS domain-containing protein [Candidatus Latescibacteria bacterium]|nr:PAS domain-containing protein [Candidatus Latescibacterota bacterium]